MLATSGKAANLLTEVTNARRDFHARVSAFENSRLQHGYHSALDVTVREKQLQVDQLYEEWKTKFNNRKTRKY